MDVDYTFGILKKKEPVETMYLGEDGLIPLEVKFMHNPDSSHGFCGGSLKYKCNSFLEI